MKADAVHAILTPPLTACYRANGFEPVNRAKKTWYKEGNGRFLFIRTQLDTKYGYSKPMGEKDLCTPYVTGMHQDAMSYLADDDVRNWASFLVDAIPCAMATLERLDRGEGIGH